MRPPHFFVVVRTFVTDFGNETRIKLDGGILASKFIFP